MDWFCLSTHGNEFQAGFPDVYACHATYGPRWIEVKNPAGFSFTNAQKEVFHKFASKNIGIWILMSAEPYELQKLHGSPNWYFYLPDFMNHKNMNGD